MTSSLVENIQGRLPVGGEFQGHNGDCVEYAFMVARTSAQPWRPCDGAELQRLTNESVASGEASPSGAMTNAELAWLCAREGVPQVQTTAGGLIALAQSEAGKHPICMGFSNGQALPGNEQNVFGHCVAVLDWDGAVFTLANGDSTNGRAGQLDTATPAQIAAAQPQQVTILEVDMTTAYDSYFDITPGHYALKSEPAIVLSGDELLFWQSMGGAPGLPVGPVQYSLQGELGATHLGVRQYERAIMVWDPEHKLDNPPQKSASGQFYLAHMYDARVLKLFDIAQPAPAPAAQLVINGGAPVNVQKIEVTYG